MHGKGEKFVAKTSCTIYLPSIKSWK